MDKKYIVDKLEELKNTHQSKLENIDDILAKCNSHEINIEEKIKCLKEDNQNLLDMLKSVENIFDMIVKEVNK